MFYKKICDIFHFSSNKPLPVEPQAVDLAMRLWV